MTLILFIAPLNAHHITRFSYTWMQVGKALVTGYRVTLIVKPPERTLDLKGLKPKPAPAGVNKGLSGYTHHFQAFVEDVRLREPVPLLPVALSARGFHPSTPLRGAGIPLRRQHPLEATGRV